MEEEKNIRHKEERAREVEKLGMQGMIWKVSEGESLIFHVILGICRC